MGPFSVLANDEEMLLTDLSFKVRKKFLGPKNDFPKFGFWTVKFLLVNKNYQYPNSNSPLFGPIVEKRVGSFSRRNCQFGPVQKVGFF